MEGAAFMVVPESMSYIDVREKEMNLEELLNKPVSGSPSTIDDCMNVLRIEV